MKPKYFILLAIIGVLGTSTLFIIKKKHQKKQAVSKTFVRGSVNPETEDNLIIDNFFIDFESNPALTNTSTIVPGKAHSGKFSSKIEGKDSYSANFSNCISKLKYDKITKVNIGAWFFTSSENINAMYVFTIEDTVSKKSVLWEGVNLKNKIKKDEWTFVDTVISIPSGKLKPEYRFAVYAWNKENNKICIDDISVTFLGVHEKISVTNDMENQEWATSELGHNSEKSFKLEGRDKYGPSATCMISDLSYYGKTSVDVVCWIYSLTENIDASYVLEMIDTTSKEKKFIGFVNIDTKNFKLKEWTKIYSSIDVPPEVINPGCRINAYVWNKNDNTIYCDDLYFRLRYRFNERKGNNPWCDLVTMINNTKDEGMIACNKPFHEMQNLPPFQIKYLEKADIKNKNSIYLINNEKLRDGEIQPEDIVVTGNFVSESESDEILIFKKNKDCELFGFNSKTGHFDKIPFNKNALKSLGITNIKECIAADFNNDKTDELLITASEKTALLKISTGVNVLWQNSSREYNTQNTFLAGKFSDNENELLKISSDGNWAIFSFNNNVPEVKFKSDKSTAINIWDFNLYTREIITGKFVSPSVNSLLTVFKKNNEKNCAYSILLFNRTKHRFENFFENKKGEGLIAGYDTLKTTDQIFAGNFDSDSTDEIIRYNRDNRFDLKFVKFNKKSFVIISNIDFKNYEKNQNPKFYEMTTVNVANFFNKKKSSIMTISRNFESYDGQKYNNFREIKDMPNCLQFFIF